MDSMKETGEDSRQRIQEIPETGCLKDDGKTGSTGKLWLQWHDLSFTSSDSANCSVIAWQSKERVAFLHIKKFY